MKSRSTKSSYRSGSMLVELCSSIAAASMVMLLGVTLIERSMHWTQSMQRQSTLQRELGQLASAWREDFSQATQVDYRTDRSVVVTLPQKQITYESMDNQVQRRCEWGESRSTNNTSLETYDLGVGYQATFEAPYLIVKSINPAGETVSTRLRVLGLQSSDKRYRILEAKQ